MKKTILAATIILFALGAHSQTPKAIAPAVLKPALPVTNRCGTMYMLVTGPISNGERAFESHRPLQNGHRHNHQYGAET